MAQIGTDAALAAFRQAYAEAADTGVLLKARTAELDTRVAELEAENERLRQQLAQPVAGEPPQPEPEKPPRPRHA